MTREQKEYRKRIDLEYPDRSKEALDLQKKIMKLIDELDKLGYEFICFNNQSSIRHKRGIK